MSTSYVLYVVDRATSLPVDVYEFGNGYEDRVPWLMTMTGSGWTREEDNLTLYWTDCLDDVLRIGDWMASQHRIHPATWLGADQVDAYGHVLPRIRGYRDHLEQRYRSRRPGSSDGVRFVAMVQ